VQRSFPFRQDGHCAGVGVSSPPWQPVYPVRGLLRWASTLAAVLTVALMSTATAAASTEGVLAWGGNEYGQLGVGGTSEGDVPQSVSELQEVKQVVSGVGFSLALLDNGTVMAWGDNQFSQLGIGTKVGPELCEGGRIPCSLVPLPVSGLSEVAAISAGDYHSAALLKDGRVMSWGSGGLGAGSIGESDVPVEAVGLTGVKAISAKSEQTLALLENGTVMAWGYPVWVLAPKEANTEITVRNCEVVPPSELAACEQAQQEEREEQEKEHAEESAGGEYVAKSVSADVPQSVEGLTGVAAVSAGYDHDLALLENSTVVAWGINGEGQLGDGTNETRFPPVNVHNLDEVAAIAAGGLHSLALLDDGTVVSWGSDYWGQLGNGMLAHDNSDNTNLPGPVVDLSEVVAISAGFGYSMALLADGTMMAWGENGSGQLGIGTSGPGTESDVPVQVTGSGGAGSESLHRSDARALNVADLDAAGATDGFSSPGAISAGEEHSLALAEPAAGRPAAPSIAQLSPNSGAETGGTSVTITGANFSPATTVEFGASEALSVTVHSSNSITAISPAGTGTVNVTARTLGGISPTGTAAQFSYMPLTGGGQRETPETTSQSGDTPKPPPGTDSGWRPLTKTQKLARALAKCRRKHFDKQRRIRCEAQAKKRFSHAPPKGRGA
jgi:alpha-tubulin suppressor-like RCC1 family protein